MRLLPLVLLFSLPLSARPFDPGFSVRVGGFWAEVDSSFGAKTTISNTPIRIDFESDLALEESKFSPFIELTYRFDDTNLLALNYLSLHRSAESRSTEQSYEFEWEGNRYRVDSGARLRSQLDVDIYQLVYSRTLFQGSDYSIMGTLGLHLMDIYAELDGEIKLIGEGGEEEVADRAFGEITAPLPDIGLIAGWSFADGWLVALHTQYLKVSFDDIDGSLLDLRLQLTHYIAPNLALGLAWQHYELEVEEKRSYSNVDVIFNYQGPSLMIHYDF
ncbi:hypothetical protein SAMN04488540_11138 [Ferrimonas sediminum]|uniref:Outer membrane protein n=1 Tax=Ferrimonas sediminum TaxID=718193 RepID=A0A1G8VGM5_9GAMM|nr:hypothetical protein [Ferrimonas sediminum]SDJ65188.1 hypothetical protein SAMN04488540_11138 [Ferrimonas sediminum]